MQIANFGAFSSHAYLYKKKTYAGQQQPVQNKKTSKILIWRKHFLFGHRYSEMPQLAPDRQEEKANGLGIVIITLYLKSFSRGRIDNLLWNPDWKCIGLEWKFLVIGGIRAPA